MNIKSLFYSEKDLSETRKDHSEATPSWNVDWHEMGIGMGTHRPHSSLGGEKGGRREGEREGWREGRVAYLP